MTHTSKTPHKQDLTAARFHFRWQEYVAARTDIKPAHKMILWRLALHRNVRSGRCDPSYVGLAAGAGCSERTAIRAITIAESKGLLTVERGNGRGNRNHFALKIPGETLSGRTGFRREKGDSKTLSGVSPEQGVSSTKRLREREDARKRAHLPSAQLALRSVSRKRPSRRNRKKKRVIISPVLSTPTPTCGKIPQNVRENPALAMIKVTLAP